MGNLRAARIAIVVIVLLCGPAPSVVAQEVPLTDADGAATATQRYSLISSEPLSEAIVNRETTNPLTSLWLVTLQNDYFLLDGDIAGADDQWANSFQIAPSIPIQISRTPQLHLLNQLSLAVVSLPEPEFTPLGRVSFDQTSGVGDIIMTNYLARTLRRNQGWIYGIGPTWIFPSASASALGQGKYQVGPALLGGYFEERQPFWGYVAVQQWWSFAGDSDRANTNMAVFAYSYQINLDYIEAIGDLPGGEWAIGATPYVQADWKADDANRWSVPIGTGIVYTPALSIPPRLAFEFDYYAERPDAIGFEWDFRFSVTVPVYQNPSFL